MAMPIRSIAGVLTVVGRGCRKSRIEPENRTGGFIKVDKKRDLSIQHVLKNGGEECL